METKYKCCKCDLKTEEIIFYYAYAKPNSKQDDKEVLKFCSNCYKKWLNK